MKNNKHIFIVLTALSFIAAFISVLGIFEFGDMFISFMSGNSARLGIHIANGPIKEVVFYTGALTFFIFGVFVANILVPTLDALGMIQIMLIECVLLSLSLVMDSVHDSLPSFLLLTFAMGMQNRLQFAINGLILGKGYMTGILYAIGTTLAQWTRKEKSGIDVLIIASTWIAFLSGAVCGALSLWVVDDFFSLIFPIIFIMTLVLYVRAHFDSIETSLNPKL